MTENETAVFADDEACTAAIARTGAIDRDLAKIESAKAKAVADASLKFEDQATPLHEERAGLLAGIKSYCAEHRDRLTKNNKTKTVTFASGKAAWRLGRQKVTVDPSLADKIIALLKKRGHTSLIRVREDLILSEIGKPEAKPLIKGIKGITIEPGTESFSVEPIAAELVERP